MNFARKQLEKYGWTDGKGLGKHENGISQALKPKLKRSVTGIGHDAASDFTEHWWNTLYNKAAQNVQVEDKNGKTKRIKTKDDSEFEITNSTWKLQRKSKNSNSEGQYENYFVKTAILTNGGSKTEKVNESESEDEKQEKEHVFRMTDEELFAACEGRTAHKGARHGLKALGKLARIEQQEQILLMQSKYKDYSHAKKHKQKQKETIDNSELVENMNVCSDVVISVGKKKKKKKVYCIKNENDDLNDKRDLAEHIESLLKKKKKKHKSVEIDSLCENHINIEANITGAMEKKNQENNPKCKRKRNHDLKFNDKKSMEMDCKNESIQNNDTLDNLAKKHKKKKYKQ